MSIKFIEPMRKPVKVDPDIKVETYIAKSWGNMMLSYNPDNAAYAGNTSVRESIKYLDRIDLSGKNLYSFGEVSSNTISPVTDLNFALAYMKGQVDSMQFVDNNLTYIRMKVYNQSASGLIPDDIAGLDIGKDIQTIRDKVEKAAILRYIDFSPDMTEVYTETVLFEGNSDITNTSFVFDFGLLFEGRDTTLRGNNFISNFMRRYILHPSSRTLSENMLDLSHIPFTLLPVFTGTYQGYGNNLFYAYKPIYPEMMYPFYNLTDNEYRIYTVSSVDPPIIPLTVPAKLIRELKALPVPTDTICKENIYRVIAQSDGSDCTNGFIMYGTSVDEIKQKLADLSEKAISIYNFENPDDHYEAMVEEKKKEEE